MKLRRKYQPQDYKELAKKAKESRGSEQFVYSDPEPVLHLERNHLDRHSILSKLIEALLQVVEIGLVTDVLLDRRRCGLESLGGARELVTNNARPG